MPNNQKIALYYEIDKEIMFEIDKLIMESWEDNILLLAEV